jgi:deoxyribose-phosphate aldolase
MVAHLRRLLPDTVRIKAAGGIRDLGHTETLLNAGAERIGSSSGVDILLSKK